MIDFQRKHPEYFNDWIRSVCLKMGGKKVDLPEGREAAEAPVRMRRQPKAKPMPQLRPERRVDNLIGQPIGAAMGGEPDVRAPSGKALPKSLTTAPWRLANPEVIENDPEYGPFANRMKRHHAASISDPEPEADPTARGSADPMVDPAAAVDADAAPPPVQEEVQEPPTSITVPPWKMSGRAGDLVDTQGRMDSWDTRPQFSRITSNWDDLQGWDPQRLVHRYDGESWVAAPVYNAGEWYGEEYEEDPAEASGEDDAAQTHEEDQWDESWGGGNQWSTYAWGQGGAQSSRTGVTLTPVPGWQPAEPAPWRSAAAAAEQESGPPPPTWRRSPSGRRSGWPRDSRQPLRNLWDP